MDSPLIQLLLFAGSLYLLKIWWDDYKAFQSGTPNPKALPGATPSSFKWVAAGAIGAILLTALETGGEMALGVSSEQSTISAFFLFAMMGAAIIEEVIFRGYIVIQSKGKSFLILSIIGFSLLFSLGHYQYYTEVAEEGSATALVVTLDTKSLWTLGILFLNSLWFYALRFLPANPHRSLLPCFAAHLASNLAVFAIKAVQGFVDWSW